MSLIIDLGGVSAASMFIALVLCALLLIVAARDFSQTGPRLRQEVLSRYAGYSAWALLRLALWTLLLLWWMGLFGGTAYLALSLADAQAPDFGPALLASLASIALISSFQLCRHLLYIPCSLMISSHYSMKRLIPLWRHLSVTRLRWAGLALLGLWLLPLVKAGEQLLSQGEASAMGILGLGYALLAAPLVWVFWPSVTAVRCPAAGTTDRPNILMIGCDTLRVDRLGLCGYPRNLTPFLDALGRKGTLFNNCYTPIARTAPSLNSLLTGTWPATHGIRTNFTTTAEAAAQPIPLARVLSQHGYRTAAISDWSGSDLGKFDFGFDQVDAPSDQWNIKYLIRQGPKHLRFFLTLFTHNRFGKALLPELYYLAGKPLTASLGRRARRTLCQLAKEDQPFFLNLFMGTTHPPFGPEYPYYTRFGQTDYRGESKFGMAKLADPDEIIQSQKEPRSAFDLDQIIDLYDSCVQNFDDEVRKICHHLGRCGLDRHTLVVIYSDHGMEFFEHGTWGQGNNIFGSVSARIPLLIHDPRKPGPGKVDRPCRSIDLMPTLLELCGVPVPDSVQGHSLSPQLKGERDLLRPCYYETGLWLAPPPGQSAEHIRYPELTELLEVPDKATGTLSIKPGYRPIIEQARDRLLRLENWVLIRIALKVKAQYLLFNLDEDPHCHHDVAADNPQIVERLKQLMEEIGGFETADTQPRDTPATKMLAGT